MEALWQCLAQGYRGVTCVHAPLLEVCILHSYQTYLRTGQSVKAQQICDSTELNATDDTGCLTHPGDVAEYVSLAGAMYASAGSYATAEELWDTVRIGS